jgi:hypothetical protein
MPALIETSGCHGPNSLHLSHVSMTMAHLPFSRSLPPYTPQPIPHIPHPVLFHKRAYTCLRQRSCACHHRHSARPPPLEPSPAAAAFIDSDEFLVITDGTRDLPAMLAQYEQYGGLVANWRILGSSEGARLRACGGEALPVQQQVTFLQGPRLANRPIRSPHAACSRLAGLGRHAAKHAAHAVLAGGHKEHQESTLEAYTSCYPEQVGQPLRRCPRLSAPALLQTGLGCCQHCS